MLTLALMGGGVEFVHFHSKKILFSGVLIVLIRDYTCARVVKIVGIIIEIFNVGREVKFSAQQLQKRINIDLYI